MVTYDEITEEILKVKPKYIRENYIAIAETTGLTPFEIQDQRTMAIISNVRFGVTDRDEVALTFDAMGSESSGSCPYLNAEQAIGFIKDYGVRDVHELSGKPVWMLSHGNLFIWVEPCVMKVK